MITGIDNTPYGNIYYEEGFFSGKKKVFINNQELEKVNKLNFIYHAPEGDIPVRLKGNYLLGVKLFFNNDNSTGIEVIPHITWYEILIAVFMLVFGLVWGNVPQLVVIIPLIGGIIGVCIAVITTIFAVFFMRKVNHPLYKVLIGLAGFVCMFLILLAVGLVFVMILAALQK